MSAALRRRARRVRANALVRRRRFRRQGHAAGVWYRLRRVLVEATAAYVIPEEEARRLIAEGVVPEPVGRELEPEKTLLFVDQTRLTGVRGRREVPLRLGPELLGARCLLLVPAPD